MNFKFLDSLPTTLGGFYRPFMLGVKIIGIIIISILVVKMGSIIIKKVFEKQKSFKYGINSRKVDTMSTLLVSVFRYAIYIVAIITILTDIFDLKSVLAAAGIGGVALGFGAQSLIKDVISGFFIILEDQYAVGDVITIDTMNGTVEEMELRVTKIRNINGDLYIVPNGEIKRVTNHTRGNKAVIVDIPIAYSSDIQKAVEAANGVCEEVAGQFESIVEAPQVIGITSLGRDNMNLRIMGKTIANEQWEVERKIRLLIKEKFDQEKIEFFDANKLVMSESNTRGDGHGRQI
ncbi:MAG: mechanosensitive ion channel family protein [Clostridia bacterium]|nr:mechanosensitive ion channel family protein [Clostridia bacterium]